MTDEAQPDQPDQNNDAADKVLDQIEDSLDLAAKLAKCFDSQKLRGTVRAWLDLIRDNESVFDEINSIFAKRNRQAILRRARLIVRLKTDYGLNEKTALELVFPQGESTIVTMLPHLQNLVMATLQRESGTYPPSIIHPVPKFDDFMKRLQKEAEDGANEYLNKLSEDEKRIVNEARAKAQEMADAIEDCARFTPFFTGIFAGGLHPDK